MQIISNQYLTLSVSEEGAEARSIIYKGEERLYQGDQGWKRRSPILFPWAGRLRNLTYTYDGVAYSLPQHGFARDHILEVTEKKEDSVTFRLLSDENTLLSYPRAFALYVTYRLEGNTLRFSMAVENRSEKEMTFGIGVHPGFILRGGEERLEIEGGDGNFILLDKNGSRDDSLGVEGSSIPLSFFRDNRTLIIPGARKAILKENLELDMGDWQNLVVWRNGCDSFLCLEPWANLPSRDGEEENFNTRGNVQRLAPGEMWKEECSFTFL